MKRIIDIFRIDLDTSRRIFGLDIMRSIGILIILEAHAFHLISNYFPDRFMFIPLLDKVNFSFILSGYLIGTTLIKLYNRDDFNFRMVRNFWVRRWIRTIPAYFLIITAMVALRYTFTHVGFEFPWRYYLFIQNLYYPEHDPGYFFPEGWSLSVEEWFYFLVPAFVFIGNILLSKVLSKKQLILSIIISIVAVSTCLRVHRAMNTPELDVDLWNSLIRKVTLLRLDTLMFGVFAAFVRYYYTGFWEQNRQVFFYLFVAGMAVTLVGYPFFLHHNMWLKTFYVTQVGLSVMFLVPKLEGMKTGRGFWLKFFTYFSKVSFCIFLLNRTPILKSMMQVIPPRNLPMAMTEYVLFIIVVLVSATLLHKYVEKPILKLRPAAI